MLKNYFKIALRNISRNKLYSFINIFGLAVGITACVLIFLYVKDELSYDKHHPDFTRIFRVNTYVTLPTQNDNFGGSAMPTGPSLKEDFPQVEAFTRIGPVGDQTVWYEGNMFTEKEVAFADSSLFEVFSYPLLYGDPKKALAEPNTLVLTEDKARAYFGDPSAALGKMLKFTFKSYKVTGVIKKTNTRTHIPADVFLAMVSRSKQALTHEQFLNLELFTYVKLKPEITNTEFETTLLPKFYDKRIKPWSQTVGFTGKVEFKLQPVHEIHFGNDLQFDAPNNVNPSYIYIFSFVAAFILLIACINYMNLATARSAKRAKEVGMRKVVGASKRQLVGQFIGESVLVSFFAILLSLVLVEVLLPVFNGLTNKDFTFGSIMNGDFALLVIGVVLFVGLFAGSYPAFYLSRFQPVEVLKGGGFNLGRSEDAGFLGRVFSPVNLRKTLVVAQFTISVVLIICTIVVFSQISFMKEKNLGFDKEQVMVIQMPVDSTVNANLQTVKNEILKDPAVKGIAASGSVPGSDYGRLLFSIQENGKEVEKPMNLNGIDYDYLKVMGIQLTKGRNFSKDFTTDTASVLINEAAVKLLGWKDPINKKIQSPGFGEVTVIGVVGDYNYTSLHNPVEPLVMYLSPSLNRSLNIKISGGNITNTVSAIEKKWRKFDPGHPMEYFFLDENFNARYKSEEKMLSVFGYFAALTILISCLGLFGLASFATEQRTKEIGIRKVLGASVGNIVTMINKDFIVLIIVSFVFAFPVAWYFMDKWLQDFHYRVDIGWLPFVAAALAALLVSVTTISIQAFKAAYSNPVRALKYE